MYDETFLFKSVLAYINGFRIHEGLMQYTSIDFDPIIRILTKAAFPNYVPKKSLSVM